MNHSPPAASVLLTECNTGDPIRGQGKHGAAQQADHLTLVPLPGDAPDGTPRERLWKDPTRHSHHRDVPTFEALTATVDSVWADVGPHPAVGRRVLGRYLADLVEGLTAEWQPLSEAL